ncbi:MAG: hypothetical protein JWP15_2798 [Alphaproteobacteria bacterium]|nr:hypothetical protein [Alphaproteobacteria bacterium]
MIRSTVFALSALALVAAPAFAKAPQCRDAKGHFTPCPKAAPAPATVKVTHTTVVHRQVATHAPAAPAAGKPTAKCKDGSVSYSKTHSGTCSHHGGVASWS